MTVFLDTSALYAVMDRDDAFHPAAKEVWSGLLGNEDRLVTSNYVLVETYALVQHRLGMDAVRVLVQDVQPVITEEWVGEEDHRAAVGALVAAGRRELSLVDCVSFQVMRRLRLRHVFTFDAHFGEQGFEVLPKRGDG